MSRAEELFAQGEREVQAYMRRHSKARKADRTFDCEYDHLDCSCEPAGPCIDELTQLIDPQGVL